ncbi:MULTISPECIES: hypothetical protein [Streptomyces]|uniref:hypothetical protein n=1 Tax=Streptomyces TaxID=1883 RepID=UPI001314A5EA|nr:hypothetical protein [Streptomyces scabiei]MDX2537154.1 hypothetical protein [Streptomyces scabiei]MDX2575527.1 hypothetical protein [Streptomyces scabiei]MDX2652992.1 hypothetical protein [Streptomyces scabiei]MDX2718749.1 hypothetical protein [Streptomyces scabiei]MDX2797494.1 hypothetical protein [Streptomyces scabiei]
MVAVWMTLLLGLQLRHCARALGPSSGSFPAAFLLLQSFLVLVPLPVMRDEWAGISGLLAGTFLITVRGGAAWVLAGAVGVAQAGAVLADAHAVGATSLSVLVTGSTGVSFLSVAWRVWPGSPNAFRPLVGRTPGSRSSMSGCGSPGICTI